MAQKVFAFILTSFLIQLNSADDTRELWASLRAADVADMTERHQLSLEEINQVLSDSDMSYRLPNNSFPINYDIHIITDIDKGLFNYTGRVKIQFLIVGMTQFITLHYRNQTIENIDLLSTVGTTRGRNLTFVKHEAVEMIVVQLPNPTIDGQFILDITFTSELDTRRGFYRSSYIDEWGVEKWVASTQFSPIDARHAIICYDEPRFRATFSVAIQHDQSYHALSNMPILNVTNVEGTEYVITRFNKSLPMQSYLLAFTISNFDYIQNNDVDIPQRIYAKPSSIRNGEGDFIINEIGPILKMCDELFGVPHALPKLDHVAVPYHVYSAMENYGLYTYAEWNLLLDPREEKKYEMLEIIAHEIAHHLFGNYVNLPFWDNLWLKEGFATLYQFVIPAKIYPEKYFKDGLRTKACVRGANVDLTTSTSMTTYVETEPQIRAKFDAISYSKAGCFLGMIMNAISEETWLKAMRYYLTENALKTSGADEVHAAIQKAINEDFGSAQLDIASIMKTWENQPGFPIVKVEKNNGTILLSQERFWTKSGQIYSIPINYATNSSSNFSSTKVMLWMHNETLELEPTDWHLDDWIILNIQQTGYYRVNYAVDIWHSIISALNNDHEVIHSINRQQLFIDMEYALTSGYATPTMAFDHLKYLRKEVDSDAWTQAGILMNDIQGKFYDTPAAYSLIIFYDSLYFDHLTKIGFNSSDSNETLRNSLIDISCRNHFHPCLFAAKNKMLAEYETNEKFTDYCHGMRTANETQRDAIYNFMLTVNSTTRRNAAMNGMSCSHNKSFLRKFLNSMMDLDNEFYTSTIRVGNIRKMMTESVFGLEEVMSFMMDNKHAFKDRDYFAATAVVAIVEQFITTVNTQRHFEEAKQIINEYYMIYDEITPNIQRTVISSMEEKIQWKSKQNYEEIYEYFFNELNITTTTSTTTTEEIENSSPTTTAPQPDSASLISWSLIPLLFSLTFLIFAL